MNNRVLVAVALVLALPAVSHAQERTAESQKRRDQIQIMEGVLARAVVLGAEEVSRKLQQIEPGVTWLAGQVRARGFVLDDYGVFFDVEIPALRQSVLWSRQMLDRDTQNALALLKRTLDSMPDSPVRQQAQLAFRRLEVQVAPVATQQQAAVADQPAPGVVRSATTGVPPVEAAAPVVPADPPPLIMTDPVAEYERAVTSRLIDAMLDYSLNLNLESDEWLSVAARDSLGPSRFGEPYDFVTIFIRVRGSDLSIYAADRSRREEIRRKVDVRVF
ncbi:MAG TPA: hypothetical protein VLD67_02415 [Vicinamibacterales bacterium]|nr:hypothetical protein [Vicinamibacterales bacterium]